MSERDDAFWEYQIKKVKERDIAMIDAMRIANEVNRKLHTDIATRDEMIAKLEVSTLRFLDFTAQLRDQRRILPAEIDDFEDAAKSALAELESWREKNNNG